MSSSYVSGFSYACYKHIQTEPSTTWVVHHGLTTVPFLTVSVYENGVLTVIKPLDVVLTSATVVTITFSTPRTGEVVIL